MSDPQVGKVQGIVPVDPFDCMNQKHLDNVLDIDDIYVTKFASEFNHSSKRADLFYLHINILTPPKKQDIKFSMQYLIDTFPPMHNLLRSYTKIIEENDELNCFQNLLIYYAPMNKELRKPIEDCTPEEMPFLNFIFEINFSLAEQALIIQNQMYQQQQQQYMAQQQFNIQQTEQEQMMKQQPSSQSAIQKTLLKNAVSSSDSKLKQKPLSETVMKAVLSQESKCSQKKVVDKEDSSQPNQYGRDRVSSQKPKAFDDQEAIQTQESKKSSSDKDMTDESIGDSRKDGQVIQDPENEAKDYLDININKDDICNKRYKARQAAFKKVSDFTSPDLSSNLKKAFAQALINSGIVKRNGSISAALTLTRNYQGSSVYPNEQWVVNVPYKCIENGRECCAGFQESYKNTESEYSNYIKPNQQANSDASKSKSTYQKPRFLHFLQTLNCLNQDLTFNSQTFFILMQALLRNVKSPAQDASYEDLLNDITNLDFNCDDLNGVIFDKHFKFQWLSFVKYIPRDTCPRFDEWYNEYCKMSKSKSGQLFFHTFNENYDSFYLLQCQNNKCNMRCIYRQVTPFYPGTSLPNYPMYHQLDNKNNNRDINIYKVSSLKESKDNSLMSEMAHYLYFLFSRCKFGREYNVINRLAKSCEAEIKVILDEKSKKHMNNRPSPASVKPKTKSPPQSAQSQISQSQTAASKSKSKQIRQEKSRSQEKEKPLKSKNETKNKSKFSDQVRDQTKEDDDENKRYVSLDAIQILQRQRNKLIDQEKQLLLREIDLLQQQTNNGLFEQQKELEKVLLQKETISSEMITLCENQLKMIKEIIQKNKHNLELTKQDLDRVQEELKEVYEKLQDKQVKDYHNSDESVFEARPGFDVGLFLQAQQRDENSRVLSRVKEQKLAKDLRDILPKSLQQKQRDDEIIQTEVQSPHSSDDEAGHKLMMVAKDKEKQHQDKERLLGRMRHQPDKKGEEISVPVKRMKTTTTDSIPTDIVQNKQALAQFDSQKYSLKTMNSLNSQHQFSSNVGTSMQDSQELYGNERMNLTQGSQYSSSMNPYQSQMSNQQMMQSQPFYNQFSQGYHFQNMYSPTQSNMIPFSTNFQFHQQQFYPNQMKYSQMQGFPFKNSSIPNVRPGPLLTFSRTIHLNQPQIGNKIPEKADGNLAGNANLPPPQNEESDQEENNEEAKANNSIPPQPHGQDGSNIDSSIQVDDDNDDYSRLERAREENERKLEENDLKADEQHQ